MPSSTFMPILSLGKQGVLLNKQNTRRLTRRKVSTDTDAGKDKI